MEKDLVRSFADHLKSMCYAEVSKDWRNLEPREFRIENKIGGFAGKGRADITVCDDNGLVPIEAKRPKLTEEQLKKVAEKINEQPLKYYLGIVEQKPKWPVRSAILHNEQNPTLVMIYPAGAASLIDYNTTTKCQEITNIAQFLSDFRQRFWSGQAYNVMYDELTKFLLCKWWSETQDKPLVFDNYRQIWAEVLSYISDDTATFGDILDYHDDRIPRILNFLRLYKVSGNNQLFHLTNYAWLTKVCRKDQGQYFTPPLLKRLMVEIYKPEQHHKICDPCGGSAGFLIAAADAMQNPGAHNFYYYEIDEHHAFKTAKTALCTYSHPITENNLAGCQMNARDSLDGDWDVSMDLIYTNVPFGLRVKSDQYQKDQPTRKILDQYETGRRRASQLSQVLFIEQCLKQLKPGGRLATIVDRGVVTNERLRPERRKLSKMAWLELVVSLPAIAFKHFAGTGFPTYILFFRKIEPSTTAFSTISEKGLGYDENGRYLTETGDYSAILDDIGWSNSVFPEVIETYRNGLLDKINYTILCDVGDWHYGAYKYRNSKLRRLKDIAHLLKNPWQPAGLNQTPTVDRGYRSISTSHLKPKKKAWTLKSGCILFSRLASEDPCCAIIQPSWDGAGCTNENYIIELNHEASNNCLYEIWHAINCCPISRDFLRCQARGQGRGRIKENDLMNLPIKPLSATDQIKVKNYIDRSVKFNKAGTILRKCFDDLAQED